MANFNLVIDTSNFKPFDINPALQLIRDYTNEYTRLENRLDKIAEAQGGIALPENSKYKPVLDNYNEAFKQAVDSFNKGMNTDTIRDIMNIKNQYNQLIVPIKQAVDSYNKYVDRWRSIATLDSSAILGYNYTVDDFYGNANPDLGYTSGKQVELDSLKYFTGLNNALTKTPELSNKISKDFNFLVQKPGISSEEALKIALDSYADTEYSQDVEDIKSHLNNVYRSQGVQRYTDEAKLLVWDRVINGFVLSLQAPKYTNLGRDNSELQQAKIDYENARRLKALADAGYILDEDGKPKYVGKPSSSSSGFEGGIVTLSDGTTLKETRKGIFYPVDLSGNLITTNNSKYDKGVTRAELNKILGTDGNLERDKDGLLSTEVYATLSKSFKPIEFGVNKADGKDVTIRNFKSMYDDHSFSDYGESWWWYSNTYKNLEDTNWNAAEKQKVVDEVNERWKEQNPSSNFEFKVQDLGVYIDYDAFKDSQCRVVVRGDSEKGHYDHNYDETAPTKEEVIEKMKADKKNIQAIGSGNSYIEALDSDNDFVYSYTQLLNSLKAAQSKDPNLKPKK